MIFKNLFGFRQFFSTQTRKELNWKLNPNGVEIFYQEPKFLQKLVFYATVNIKISQFLTAFQMRQKEIIYPQGINSQTDLITFLLQRQAPKAIQIKHKGQNYVLRNRACNAATKQIIQTIRDPKSIYQHLLSFTTTNKPQYFIERCDYMTRYYLKLQAECYCRTKKVNMSELLTPKIKNDILNYLNFKNQINSQELFDYSVKEEVQIREAIEQTQQKLDEINQFYLSREAWYKKMAVLVTAVHFVSFGYMIFGVDWLGWDIIEPLTYSVGVIYTLLGIRFYRKYRMDRSSQNIRDALFKFIMPPEKRTAMNQIKERLQVQKKELKKKSQQQLILKNRLAYRTSLIQSLQNTIE